MKFNRHEDRHRAESFCNFNFESENLNWNANSRCREWRKLRLTRKINFNLLESFESYREPDSLEVLEVYKWNANWCRDFLWTGFGSCSLNAFSESVNDVLALGKFKAHLSFSSFLFRLWICNSSSSSCAIIPKHLPRIYSCDRNFKRLCKLCCCET